MNASEAREVSNHNVPKLVEANYLIAKSKINDAIKGTARDGNFSTRVPIMLPHNIQDGVIEKIETHYRELGYLIEVHNFGQQSKLIDISW
ncbi:hypothetical protein [Bacillus sp. FJAT-49736]|uniref:hypothetical protein n=1 Tax=Bacillus sp. FJAT-49736 TaxID=2833582 RepID=UPI001BC9A651|nr:hypothetical protein [Bacillus sp. FJAT-49736]MBS4171908.1 hypothetical protein [Bacillus sp. FJAT-49736]